MVRNYKRKTSGPTYTKEELASAVELIRKGEWSYREANARLNIPLGTLSSHILKSIKPNVGHPPAFTRDDEQYLVKLIITLQEWGQLSTCGDILKYAEEYADLMDLRRQFARGKPTKEWYYGFIKRWSKDLKLMHSSSLEKARAEGATEEVLIGWFVILNDVLKKLDLFDKPQNIFNMDESGFVQEARRRVVVVKRDTKYANQIQSDGCKSLTTVLLTISASGVCLPPYIIYKSLRLYKEWCPKNVIKGAVYNGTKSGWTDENCFYDYFEKVFISNTKHLKRPLLLLFDGHYSHLSIKTIRLAIENDIHFLCLPSHCTHLLQPLDVYTLKYVKQQWKELLWERHKISTKAMEKQEFVHLFAKLYDYALIPAHCSTAFAKAGIFPFDSRAVKYDRIVKNISSTTSVSSQQLSQPSSNDLDLSSSLNTSIMTQQKTLVRSNSSPDLSTNSSSSSTILRNQSIDTRPAIGVSNNPTAAAYALLNDVLDVSFTIAQSTTSSDPAASTTTTSSDPAAFTTTTTHSNTQVLLPLSNISSNSDLSTIVPATADSTSPLSAVEAIVAKFLSPKQTTTKTRKRLIKRPYGASVTDLDVVGENVVKKQKKPVKKKRTDDDDDYEEVTSPKSKKIRSVSKTTSSGDTSQVFISTSAPSSKAPPYNSNNSHVSPSSIDSSNSLFQVFSHQSDPFTHQQPQYNLPYHQLQHQQSQYQQSQYQQSQYQQPQQYMSTSTLPGCGRCSQQIDLFHSGGNCTQCGVSICWSCWTSENYGVYYCNNCRFHGPII